MRVIAGTARSMPLKTPKGQETRPTTDRIKETLFNMLQAEIPGCVFIDLFAGSGGIGIEALSRGAIRAYFIDSDKEANACIVANVNFTKFADKAIVKKQDAVAGLLSITENHVDVIFADPPYEAGLEPLVLQTLSKMPYVDEDTILIIEAKLQTDFAFASLYGFDILKEKKYKTNKHVWLCKRKGFE